MADQVIAELRKILTRKPRWDLFQKIIALLPTPHDASESMVLDYLDEHLSGWPNAYQELWACIHEIREILQQDAHPDSWEELIDYYYEWCVDYRLERTFPYLFSGLENWRASSLLDGQNPDSPYGVWQLIEADTSYVTEFDSLPDGQDLQPSEPHAYLQALDKLRKNHGRGDIWRQPAALQPFFLELQANQFREIDLSEHSPLSEHRILYTPDAEQPFSTQQQEPRESLEFSNYSDGDLDYEDLVWPDDTFWVRVELLHKRGAACVLYNQEYPDDYEPFDHIFDSIEYTPNQLERKLFFPKEGRYLQCYRQTYRPFLKW